MKHVIIDVEELIDMKAVGKKEAGIEMSRDEAINRLWISAVDFHQLFGKVIDAVCASVGLSMPQFATLFVLKFSVKPLRMVDLASYLHQNSNSVSMLVNRMVKQGLLRRVRTKSDRRAVIVKLTDKGNHVAMQAIPPAWQMIKTLAANLSDSEISLLSEGLEKSKQYVCDGLKGAGEETQVKEYFKELDSDFILKIANRDS